MVQELAGFVPILTARALDEVAAWALAALMFLAFSSTASGMYLINDLLDLAADRQHRTSAIARSRAACCPPRRLDCRTFADVRRAGARVDYRHAGDHCPLSSMFYGIFIHLKSRVLIDVFMLAGLYTLRLFGGGEATGYRVSLWLLAFGSFFFLSLAMMKRVSELMALTRGYDRAAGRAYALTDLNILQVMGVTSSFVASIVLALYMQSELNPGVEHHPTLAWMLVPLLLFWQCRIWLATARGHMHDDPIIFSAGDWVSWLVAICSIVVLLFGSWVAL
jgi:4-hydroxybenzoate polyprenyltransferase